MLDYKLDYNLSFDTVTLPYAEGIYFIGIMYVCIHACMQACMYVCVSV